MKVLLDSCIARAAQGALVEAGHDVEATSAWTVDPGDDEILEYAFNAGRVVVTLDKDFGELAVVHHRSHAGIVRLVDIRADLQGVFCVATLSRYGDELERGAIVTVEATRTRVRPPD